MSQQPFSFDTLTDICFSSDHSAIEYVPLQPKPFFDAKNLV